MTTFKFHKDINEVEEPILLPADWYDFEIADEPNLAPNATLFDVIGESTDPEVIENALNSDPKAGYNLVIPLVVESPEDIYNGRKFRVWLPWPSEQDENRWDAKGQKVADGKMTRLAAFADAFGGSVDGDEIDLRKGLKGCLYVKQEKNPKSGEIGNSIDWFAGFKSYGG